MLVLTIALFGSTVMADGDMSNGGRATCTTNCPPPAPPCTVNCGDNVMSNDAESEGELTVSEIVVDVVEQTWLFVR